jgi:tartrate dehydratase beta subunit/fumarate hydratase class I family protein
MTREAVLSALARARRIVAAGACAAMALAAAEIACAQAAPRDAARVAAMSAAQAREFTIGEIRALVAVARAGGEHADPLCRAAAVRAGRLAGAAIDAVVQADKSRERELRAVGVEAAEDPAVQANYQRVAAGTLEARQTVAKGVANCPELLAQHR